MTKKFLLIVIVLILLDFHAKAFGWNIYNASMTIFICMVYPAFKIGEAIYKGYKHLKEVSTVSETER